MAVLLLAVGELAAAKKDVETVEVEGLGAVYGDDLGKAREQALADAKKRAVEQVVGVYVAGSVMVSKATVMDDQINTQTEGLIEQYDVLKEGRQDAFYKVRIRARVKREDLLRKVAELNLNPKKYGNPRIAFWVDETANHVPQTTRVAEQELMSVFIASGFVVSDVKPREAFATPQALLAASTGVLEERLKADIIVLGEASSEFNSDQAMGGFISYRAPISVKVVKTGTNEVITTANSAAGGVDITRESAARKALENAARGVGKSLPYKVLSYLRDHAFGRVEVGSVPDFAHLQDFVRVLRTMPNVRDCWVREFDGSEAQVDVDLSRGTLTEIAPNLEASKSVKFKLGAVEAYRLQVSLTAP